MAPPNDSKPPKARSKLRLPQSRLFGRQSSPQGEPPTRPLPAKTKDFRSIAEGKVVGLKHYGLDKSTVFKRGQPVSFGDQKSTGDSKIGLLKAAAGDSQNGARSVEDMEEHARKNEISNPFKLMYLGNTAALKVVFFYLVTLETCLTTGLTVGLTCYWYLKHKDGPEGAWSGSGLDFILLSFAVISPISAAIGMAFTRRERALVTIATLRTSAYHVYLAHSLWDWNDNGGRQGAIDVDWLEHCDAVLAQLIGIGDELSRFLSLPTTSRSRHRMTKAGRAEAARTTEVAYNLLESMSTQRITRLTLYSERLKKIGLPSGEISRIRQFERYLSDGIEQLRMVKMYRTPQALRSFARLFTVLLPPYYAPAFAQVAIDLNSLGIGIVNAVIVALALTGLFLSLEALEDPFTAFLALDGIDVREEFEVLYFAQLTHTRDLVFPLAPRFPAGRRAALMARPRREKVESPPPSIGQTPLQEHLHVRHFSSDVPSVIGLESTMDKSTVDEEEGEVDILKVIEYADAELGRPLLGTHHTRESSVIPFAFFTDQSERIPQEHSISESEKTGKRSNHQIMVDNRDT